MSTPIMAVACVIGVGVILSLSSTPDAEWQSVGDVKADGKLELADPTIVIPSSSIEKSVEFYEKVIGLVVTEKQESFALLGDDSMSIRIVLASSITPSNYPVIVWIVADLDEVMAELAARGAMPEHIRAIPDKGTFFSHFLGRPSGKSSYGLVVKDPDGMLIAFAKK